MNTLLYYVLLVFAVSLASNATPFVGAAYTVYAALIIMDTGANAATLALFIVVTALGASLSKNAMYALGIALRGALSRNRNIALVRGLARTGLLWPIVVVLAIIPGLPLDDYLYIATGAAETKVALLNAYIFLGKLIKSSIEIPIELIIFRSTYHALSSLGLGKLDFQLAFATLFTTLGIVIYKVDWLRVYNWLRSRIRALPSIDEGMINNR